MANPRPVTQPVSEISSIVGTAAESPVPNITVMTSRATRASPIPTGIENSPTILSARYIAERNASGPSVRIRLYMGNNTADMAFSWPPITISGSRNAW